MPAAIEFRNFELTQPYSVSSPSEKPIKVRTVSICTTNLRISGKTGVPRVKPLFRFRDTYLVPTTPHIFARGQ